MFLLIIGALVLFWIMIRKRVSDTIMSQIWGEFKYALIYQYLGLKALLEDYGMQEKIDKLVLPMAPGKVAVVTGGARGIGVEIVKKLVQCDVHVIIGCRNVAAGNKLFESIRKEGIITGNVEVLKLDLMSCKSIRDFASVVMEKHPQIHILFNNAGKMFGPYIETEDGHESQLMTNYLGHFLLTHLLLPQLKAGGQADNNSRIVNVTSCAYLCGSIDLTDINHRKQFISPAVYAQSKLAQLLFSNHINSVLKRDGVPISVYSVHPGLVNTELLDVSLVAKKIVKPLLGRFIKSPEKGAVSILYAGLAYDMENKGGMFISNCQIVPTNEIASLTDLQEQLFRFTMSLLKIKVFGKE